MGEIHGVDLPGFRQAVVAVVHQLVVWLGLPPIEAGEEVDHVRVSLEHGHGVVTSAVHPSATRIRPHIRSAPRGLARGLVSPGHHDFPGRSAQRIGGLGSEPFGPQWVVVLVSIFLIRLRDDAAQALLLLSLGEHEGVLRSRPLLKGGEVEPVRRPVLMHVVDGMAGRQMPVRIPLLDQSPGGVRPPVVPVLIEIVAEVPGDVREGAESRNGIADESMLVRASRRGVNAAVVHVQDERKDHVPIAGKAKCALELLPIGHLKPAVVEARMIDVLGHAKFGEGVEHSATKTESVALPGTSEEVKVAHALSRSATG